MQTCANIFMEYCSKLRGAGIGCCKLDEPLSKHSTLAIGGPASVFVEPCSVNHLISSLNIARQTGIPCLLVGCGSNLLFDDSGLAGAVIKIGKNISGFFCVENSVFADSGIWLPCLAHNLGKLGLTGLEHIVGIPGTLGGLVFMNGGSRRQNIGEAVQSVTVLGNDGSIRKIKKEECDFGNRSSIFQKTREAILSIELKCGFGNPIENRRLMLDILNNRRSKFPLSLPNCGSVFKATGPVFDEFGPPGRIIEETGLKGTRIKDIQISMVHANFFVNLGNGTSFDFVELARLVRNRVHQRIGHYLECEVQYVSPTGEVSALHDML